MSSTHTGKFCRLGRVHCIFHKRLETLEQHALSFCNLVSMLKMCSTHARVNFFPSSPSLSLFPSSPLPISLSPPLPHHPSPFLFPHLPLFTSIFSLSSSPLLFSLSSSPLLFSLSPSSSLPPLTDYSCALQRDILIHGRLYVTQTWLCFYANIFSWETLVRKGRKGQQKRRRRRSGWGE